MQSGLINIFRKIHQSQLISYENGEIMKLETEFAVWIRQNLWKLNRELTAARVAEDSDEMGRIEEKLVSEGMHFVEKINGQPTIYDEQSAFPLLGDVGTFAASCARHNVKMYQEGDDAIKPLGGLINRLSIITGTAPRAIIHHFTVDNIAVEGAYRGFTHSDDEKHFFRIGTDAMIAYDEAAQGLKRVQAIGISHPLSADMLKDVGKTIGKVEQAYREIEILKPGSFYGDIMPYLMAHKIRSKAVRGFSAGDFGSANEVDLLIGVCGLDDPFYSGICLEKMPYMRRHGQESLRSVCQYRSMLDLFLEVSHQSEESWFKESGNAFLDVIEANRSVAKRHHDSLVDKYLTRAIPDDAHAGQAKEHLAHMLKFLERIRDLRAAESLDVEGGRTHKVNELTALLGR